MELHIQDLLLHQLQVLTANHAHELIPPRCDNIRQALDQVLTILMNMSKQQRQNGILLLLEWSVHAGKSKPSLHETHLAKYIVAEVLIAYFESYVGQRHHDVSTSVETMETSDFWSTGMLKAIIDTCFRVFCIHYDMIKRCQARCRSKSSPFNRLFSVKASRSMLVDRTGYKDTQNERLLDNIALMWKKVLGYVSQFSVQLIHDRFYQSIKGTFGCSLQTFSGAQLKPLSNTVQTCDSYLLCYMIQCFSSINFDPFLVNDCWALDAQRPEYGPRVAGKVKRVASFLRDLQSLTLKSHCYLVRLAALRLLSRILENESQTLSQKLYKWYCQTSNHRQITLWYCKAIFNVSANVSEWCVCLLDLHSLARQHCSNAIGLRLSKKKWLLQGPAWALRAAVMSLAPNNVFERFCNEDFNQITRIQLRTFASSDPSASFSSWEYDFYEKNAEAISDPAVLIRSTGMLFVQVLQRSIILDQPAFEKECIECLNRMQCWLCDGVWRGTTLNHESFSILAQISCAIICYQGAGEHVHRLVAESINPLDERRLIGLQSLHLYHKLMHSPSWQYTDRISEDTIIQPLLWAGMLEKRALANAHKICQASFTDKVDQILMDCSTHCGNNSYNTLGGQQVSEPLRHTIEHYGLYVTNSKNKVGALELGYKLFCTTIQCFTSLYRETRIAQRVWVQILVRATCHQNAFVRTEASSAVCTISKEICSVTSSEKIVTVLGVLYQVLVEELSGYLTADLCLNAHAAHSLVLLLVNLLEDTNFMSFFTRHQSKTDHFSLSSSFDCIEALGVFLLMADCVELQRSTLKLLRLIAQIQFCTWSTRDKKSIYQVLLDPIPTNEFFCNLSRFVVSSNNYEHLLRDLGSQIPYFVISQYMGHIFALFGLVKPAISSIIWDQFHGFFVRVSTMLKDESLSSTQIVNKLGDDKVRYWGNIVLLATTNALRVDCNYDTQDVDTYGGGNQDHADSGETMHCQVICIRELCQVLKSDSARLQRVAIFALGNVSISLTHRVLDCLVEFEAEALPAFDTRFDGGTSGATNAAPLGNQTQSTRRKGHDREGTSLDTEDLTKKQLRLRWALIRTFRLIIIRLVKLLCSPKEWIVVKEMWSSQLRDRYSTLLTQCCERLHDIPPPHLGEESNDTAEFHCLRSMIRQDFCAILSSLLQIEDRLAVDHGPSKSEVSLDYQDCFSVLTKLSASSHRNAGDSIAQHQHSKRLPMNESQDEASDKDQDNYIVQTWVDSTIEDGQKFRLYLSWIVLDVRLEENQLHDDNTPTSYSSCSVRLGNKIDILGALTHEWVIISLARMVGNQKRVRKLIGDNMLGSENLLKLLEIIDQCFADQACHFYDCSQQRWFCHYMLQKLVTIHSKTNHIINSATKKCLYSASPLSDKASSQAYAIAIEYFYTLTRLPQMIVPNNSEPETENDSEFFSSSDDTHCVIKGACILHAGDQHNWIIRQQAWNMADFLIQHQRCVGLFHASSSAATLHVDSSISHIVSCTETRSISALLCDAFGEKNAYDMCRAIGKFILCCDSCQQRKLLNALPCWANCIAMKQQARQGVLLRLFLQVTLQLGTVFVKELQDLWQSLAFPKRMNGTGAEFSSNLIIVLQFLFERSRNVDEFPIGRELVAWLGRVEDNAKNVMIGLISIVQVRQTKSWQHESDNIPERPELFGIFDDAVALIRLMTVNNNCFFADFTSGELTMEVEFGVFLLHSIIGVLFFILQSDQKIMQNATTFGSDAYPVTSQTKKPRSRKATLSDFCNLQNHESSDFGGDSLSNNCETILQECLLVLRHLMRSQSNWLQSLQILISDRCDAKGQGLNAFDHRFDQLIRSLVAVIPMHTQLIWNQICMNQVIQTTREIISVRNSESTQLQVKQATQFALRMQRMLRRPFEAKMVLTILELLHKSLDQFVLCENQQINVSNNPPDMSLTLLRASSKALVMECLSTLDSMVSDIPASKLALCPQIIWVAVALLNHCSNTSVRLATHKLLLSILSVPNILSNNSPPIQILHDLVMVKCPDHWTPHQRSIFRVVLCCPPAFSSHPAIAIPLTQRFRMCDILLHAVSILSKSRCASLFSDHHHITDTYWGSEPNQITTFLECTVEDQITTATLGLLPHWLATSSIAHYHLMYQESGMRKPMYSFSLARRIQTTLTSAWSDDIAPFKAAQLKEIIDKYKHPFAVSNDICKEIVEAFEESLRASSSSALQEISGSHFGMLCIEIWMSNVSQCSEGFFVDIKDTKPDLYERALVKASLLLVESQLTSMLSSHEKFISERNSLSDAVVKPLEEILHKSHPQKHRNIWGTAVHILSLISSLRMKSEESVQE